MITLQGINISHLGKRKIIFKMRDMLVPWSVMFLFFIFSYLSSQIDCKETLRRRDPSIFLLVVPWGYGQPSSVYSLLPQRSSGVCLAWRFQRSQTRRLQKARNWRLVGETSGFIVLGYKHWGGLMKGGLLQWVFFVFFNVYCFNMFFFLWEHHWLDAAVFGVMTLSPLIWSSEICPICVFRSWEALRGQLMMSYEV